MGPSQEMPSPPNGPPQVHLGPDLVEMNTAKVNLPKEPILSMSKRSLETIRDGRGLSPLSLLGDWG